jgi:segregation and condensation protein A
MSEDPGAAPPLAAAPHPRIGSGVGSPAARVPPSPRLLGEGRREGSDAAEAGTYTAPEQLVLDLDGYEGPIDLLLSLAREQKVDLTKISILALADQYLAFIAAQRRLKLEIAADYLVMAAWLAFLKSRLLLPEPREEDAPEAEEMAAALGHRLQLLEAMQTAGGALLARPQLGRDFWLRGAPEGLATVPVPVWQLDLYELLRAYGDSRRRTTTAVLAVEPSAFYSMDDALQRFARFLGRVPAWRALVRFLPDDIRGELMRRSALAATFAAALELVRDGRIELRQDRAFGPIWLRSPPPLRRINEGTAG